MFVLAETRVRVHANNENEWAGDLSSSRQESGRGKADDTAKFPGSSFQSGFRAISHPLRSLSFCLPLAYVGGPPLPTSKWGEDGQDGHDGMERYGWDGRTRAGEESDWGGLLSVSNDVQTRCIRDLDAAGLCGAHAHSLRRCGGTKRVVEWWGELGERWGIIMMEVSGDECESAHNCIFCMFCMPFAFSLNYLPIAGLSFVAKFTRQLRRITSHAMPCQCM